MSELNMPTEAEMMQKLLMPLVETMGFARVSAALDFMKPGMEKMETLKRDLPKNAQLIEDVLTIARDWSKFILEITQDKPKAA